MSKYLIVAALMAVSFGAGWLASPRGYTVEEAADYALGVAGEAIKVACPR